MWQGNNSNKLHAAKVYVKLRHKCCFRRQEKYTYGRHGESPAASSHLLIICGSSNVVRCLLRSLRLHKLFKLISCLPFYTLHPFEVGKEALLPSNCSFPKLLLIIPPNRKMPASSFSGIVCAVYAQKFGLYIIINFLAMFLEHISGIIRARAPNLLPRIHYVTTARVWVQGIF